MSPVNDNDPIDSRSTSSRLNPIPGEVVLAHQGVIWKEGAISKLSSLGLAATAQTGVAPGLDEIIDIDVDNDLPGLPVVHREHERRNSERMKARMGNNLNDQKRKRITLQAWNQLFSLLHECSVKNAPMLAQLLFSVCDMSQFGLPQGNFDGPRAWRIIGDHLAGAMGGGRDAMSAPAEEGVRWDHGLPPDLVICKLGFL